MDDTRVMEGNWDEEGKGDKEGKKDRNASFRRKER